MAETTQRTRSLAHNLLSWIGALIAIVAILNLIFLIFADIGTAHDSPYLGIVTWIGVPAFLILGIVLFIIGLFVERRRRRRVAPEALPPFPVVNLNNPRTRLVFGLTVSGLFLFLLATVIGSYQAYHYTESDAFCGATCHSVMHPEYTAYKASPHARVGCTTCHIGPGATWFVRSKLSGAYQVYATLANRYPRPIPTPVANLRPAQETCEQCHWPEKFWGAQMKVFNHFGFDQQNTPRETRLLIKTGGGSPTAGPSTGIHWHMNIANEISYVASDPQRQVIEWVRLKDLAGRVTEYRLAGSKLTPQQLAEMPQRIMDCVDCHNRPTHIYTPPDRAVDRALLANRISRDLPYIKQQAVEALSKDYNSTEEALRNIATDIDQYYRQNYADIHRSRAKEIKQAIATLQGMFRTIRFPEMNVDWRTHPDNVGHLYSPGCFRCHDDQHVSSDGRKITKDCEACHSLLGQREAGVVMVDAPDVDFAHPLDIGDLRDAACTDCHTGAPM